MGFEQLRRNFNYTVAQYLADMGFYKDEAGIYRKGRKVIYKTDRWTWRAGDEVSGVQRDFTDIDELLDWIEAV